MNDFKKPFGGGSRGGYEKKSFGRPSFGGKPSFRGGAGKTFGTMEKFQATCASCSKPCEVPFKPNGKKPVYCRECFAKNGGPEVGGGVRRDAFPPRRDFAPAPAFEKPTYKPEGESKGISDLKKQIEQIGVKLDKLIQALADKALAEKQAASEIPEAEFVEVKAPKAKKSGAKKAK